MNSGQTALLTYERRGRRARVVVTIMCHNLDQAVVQSERGGELVVPISSLRPWTVLDQMMLAVDESEAPTRVD